MSTCLRPVTTKISGYTSTPSAIIRGFNWRKHYPSMSMCHQLSSPLYPMKSKNSECYFVHNIYPSIYLFIQKINYIFNRTDSIYLWVQSILFITSFLCFFHGIRLALLVIGLVSVGWTALQCWQLGIGFEIFTTLLLSKVWSFFEWFVYSGPYFAYLYPIDRKYFYDRQRRKMFGLTSQSGGSLSASTTSIV